VSKRRNVAVVIMRNWW